MISTHVGFCVRLLHYWKGPYLYHHQPGLAPVLDFYDIKSFVSLRLVSLHDLWHQITAPLAHSKTTLKWQFC